MIDTIVIRLHDLKVHADIHNYLSNPNFTTIHKRIRVLEHKDIKDLDPFIQRDIIDYGDTGTSKTQAIRGKMHIASSHYYVAYNVNVDKNYIEWNFSLPKYFYGNNVAQFIRPVTEKKFIRGVDYNFCNQQAYLFQRLMMAIDRFFKENYIDMYVDWSKLEFNRIDICYNQIFQSKAEAMRYLNYQKKMNLKNARLNGKRFQNYNTSMMYTGDAYSVKIYHKGTEYTKGDRVEHEKINNIIIKSSLPESIMHYSYSEVETNFEKRKGMGLDFDPKDAKKYYDIIKQKKNNQLFDVDFLQKLSDKILRYEMTFRKPMMANIFKDKVFRINDFEYRGSLREFKTWWNRSLSGKDLKNVPSDFHKMFRYILKFKRKVLTAWRVIDKEDEDLNSRGGVKNLNRVNDYRFDKETLNEMVKVFRRFLMEFQVKYADCEETFMNKLIRYNEQAEKEKRIAKLNIIKKEKIKKRKNTFRMRSIYQILMKYGSWENVKKSNELTKSTYHRYKAEFKELGFEKNYISREVFNVSTDFDAYYDIELTNFKKLRPRFK